jgi:hypothetical protein
MQKTSETQKLTLQKSIYNHHSYTGENEFKFINFSKKFHRIHWNFMDYGKLWCYNLNYFEYLNQENISNSKALYLIDDFIVNIKNIDSGLEPFPISLRVINTIKFLVQKNIENQKINDSLYAQSYILLDNIEYHLLGNHLLENGFALLFSSYYFQDEKLYYIAKRILEQELEEQILNDGAHFELSPMYHQLMLYRILDSINLLKNNPWKEEALLTRLTNKAKLMLAWLKKITYEDGSIPLLNDSANGIAPSSKELFLYAKRLNISFTPITLDQSGYRKRKNSNYEIILDIGAIGPDYIPGHAHSDTFNFELYIHNKPFIIDTGLSTYESNQIRHNERSTKAHNTVQINHQNQSEVWGAFRVANRAKIIELMESKNTIKATHDGYKKNNILHTRKWVFKENSILIKDGTNKKVKAISRIHFHPNVTREDIIEKIKIDTAEFQINTYQYAPEFNTYKEALVLEIKFQKNLQIEVII